MYKRQGTYEAETCLGSSGQGTSISTANFQSHAPEVGSFGCDSSSALVKPLENEEQSLCPLAWAQALLDRRMPSTAARTSCCVQGGPRATLSSGQSIPLLGLGTWQVSRDRIQEVVTAAIEAGVRHFDCAPIYGNEDQVNVIVIVIEECISRLPTFDRAVMRTRCESS